MERPAWEYEEPDPLGEPARGVDRGPFRREPGLGVPGAVVLWEILWYACRLIVRACWAALRLTMRHARGIVRLLSGVPVPGALSSTATPLNDAVALSPSADEPRP